MPVRADIKDGVFRLEAAGDLGVPAAFELREAILENLQGADRVEVDLSEAETVGSACLQVLYALWLEAVAWNVEVTLAGASEEARRVLLTCGLDGFFGFGSAAGQGRGRGMS